MARIFYAHARQDLLNQIRLRLSSISSNIAAQIDPSDHELLRNSSDETKPEYKQIRSILRRAKASTHDIRYIYTMRPGQKPTKWEFVVDAEVNPELVSHIGDKYDVSDTPELVAGLRGPSADRNLTHDKWGYFLSGYAPILDKNGKSIGIVGVDMSANQLMQAMKSLKNVGAICIIVSVLLSIILSTLLSELILSPIEPFIKRLNMAAQGDLSPLPQVNRQDEVGKIAQAVNNLLASLREKDRMLSKMNTDYLTGLPNHRHFQEQLKYEISEAAVQDKKVALLMIDVDMFKSINDRCGFTTGDEVLRQVAKLSQGFADNDITVARYGGEEYAIILPGANIDQAVLLAEELRTAVELHDFTITPSNLEADSVFNISISATVSIGVALFPDHSKEQSGLIMASEIALYRAKHLGRNRVSAYDITLEKGHADPYEINAFIQDPTRNAIEALAAAVDARDHYTAHHSQNVSSYSLMIAEKLDMSNAEIELVYKAALLHDVGKIGIPDSVLNSPDDLDDEEMELIQTHPSLGEAIIRNSRNLDEIVPGILYHHERYDGGGYPYGIAGEDIPLLARIISVADTFDALTTNRPYRNALPVSQAIDILMNESGSQFDPKIVKAFIAKLEENEYEALPSAA